MKRQEIKLTKIFGGDDWGSRDQFGKCNFICDDELRKYFRIPKDAKAIYLVLTDKPVEGSYMVTKSESKGWPDDYNPIDVHTSGEVEKISAVYNAAFRAAEEFGFPVHVSIKLD